MSSVKSTTAPAGVMRDSDSMGGETFRKLDHAMSEKFGGYRTGGDGVYANYVEPVLHAGMHAARGTANPDHRQAEFNRAKDELKSVGKGGLREMGDKYQNGGK